MNNWSDRAVASLGAGLLVVAADGTIVAANPSAGAILGSPPSELIGRDVADVLTSLAQLRRSAESGRIEFPLPDDENKRVGCTVSSFDDPSGKCYACLFQDLLQLKQLGEERLKVLQLAAVSSAVPSILHELRNPLAAIQTMMDVILADITRGKSNLELEADIRAATSEIQRMTLSLQGLSGVGQKLRTHNELCVAPAIEGVIRVMRPTAERSGIELSCILADMKPIPFEPAVVRAVAFNLISNAVAACSRGNEVVVVARIDDDQYFELSVKDDGPGMTEDVRERATKLFFTTRRSGSGIGLALCNETAKSAGGALTLVSAPGAGTTATMRVPLSRPAD